MKTFLAILILAASQSASAQMKTETLKHGRRMCDVQIAAMSAGKPIDRGCGNFIQGVKDEMNGELNWADDLTKVSSWAIGRTA